MMLGIGLGLDCQAWTAGLLLMLPGAVIFASGMIRRAITAPVEQAAPLETPQ